MRRLKESYQYIIISAGGGKERKDLMKSYFSHWSSIKAHKMKYRNFHFNRRRNFSTVRAVKHWHRLPSQDVESPSLEIFEQQQDTARNNLFLLFLL